MEPGLRNGQLLLVRRADDAAPAPRVGQLVVVTLPPDPAGRARPLAVKRLTRIEDDGGLWVESDNTADVHRIDSWTVGALPRSALVATTCLKMPG